MTEFERETCPVCEPSADPTREIVVFRYCFMHQPSMAGSADAGVPPGDNPALRALQEGGQDGKTWCDLIHRGKRP